jgi:fatty acid desaturase
MVSIPSTIDVRPVGPADARPRPEEEDTMAAAAPVQTVKSAWWEPRIDRATLKGLMKRSDGPGLYFLAVWAVLLLLTGVGIHLARGSAWVVPAVIAYGVVLGFAYAPSHECAHGTAFRTRWLNEAVLWFSSFIWGESPTHRRFAHSHHHTNTWHWKVDAQMGYTNPVRMRTWFGDVIGLLEFWPRAKLMVRHARGRITDRERVYLPDNQVAAVVREARMLMAGYLALLAWAAIGQTWVPMLYFFIPRFAGAFGVYSFITTQHMAMAQDVNDHRLCTRSMTNSWLGRVLYWTMNYHIEHHMFAAVPCYHLGRLHQMIRHDLPPTPKGLIGVWKEIDAILRRQAVDPDYQYAAPLPNNS